MTVAVCILVRGDPGYGEAARACVASVLRHTDFALFVGHDKQSRFVAPDSPRVHAFRVPEPTDPGDRAAHFLLKFRALRQTLEAGGHDVIMLLDADAVLVKRTTEREVVKALGGHGLAMAEQTTITGSSMGPADFLEHYRQHAMVMLGEGRPAPPLADFHYYNSGVVLAKRNEMASFLDWAEAAAAAVQGPHRVGEHLITDQDYFQFWALTRHPGACRLLPWSWNHCEHWDADFPRVGARILHFSNFCLGPTETTADRMWKAEAERDEAPDATTYIVVTHDSAATLDPCLAAVAAHDHARVVVVDNGSTDGSVLVALRHPVRVVRLPHNTGFAAAANLGARLAATPNVCLLNPDAILQEPLSAVAAQRVNEAPACCAVPRLVGAGPEQSGRQPGYTPSKLLCDILETNYHAPRLVRRLKGRAGYHDRRWHWPLGTCLFMKKALFDDMGGFDGRFFMYMEDVDFGLRLFARGGAVHEIDVRVRHQGAAGSSIDGSRRLALLNNGRLCYARIHFGWLYTQGLRLLVACRRRRGL